MTKDIIITGIPRSGSSFVCVLLNRLPDVVALNETMDLSGLLAVQDSASRVRIIADYLAAVRLTVAKTGKVPQLQVAGPGDNTFLCATDEKSAKVGSTLVDVGKVLPQGFTLALKHLNCFAALLHHLRQHFNCLALVRNPLATLASWHTLDHPMRQGHMPVAETLDGVLAARLAEVADARQRRLVLLGWYYARFTELLAAEHIQRYEDIVETNGGCLAAMVPPARALPNLLDEPLANRNQSRLYGPAEEAMADVRMLLEDSSHACWRIYAPAEVRELLHAYQGRSEVSGVRSHTLAVADEPYRPKLSFMIVGAQKAGTTALWEYLGAHPQIAMSSPKEVHLFDAQDYSPQWTPQQIDQHYARWFPNASPDALLGEVTPIYSFLPEVAAQLRRYNPNLKLIMLLRDPAERAISNYYMEKAREQEKAPLWLALLAEPFRLWRCSDPRVNRSAYRFHSYRARGLYSFQLRNLYQHFPGNQVLVIRSRDLRRNHQPILRRVFAFLEVDQDIVMSSRIALPGELHGKRSHPVLAWLLRLSYFAERRRARGLYSLEDAKGRH